MKSSIFFQNWIQASTAHTRQAPLLHAAKLMVISMCDNPVAPATVETAATIDSKGKAALAKKFSFLANKLQAATSTEHWPWSPVLSEVLSMST